MPASSVLSEFTFHNLGPLTTTWTAPASCATSVGDVRIGLTQRPGQYIYGASCQLEVKDNSCIPTGTSADPALATNLNPTNLFQDAYFSPGLYCPSGWTTAGLASRQGSASVTWSGIFSPFSAIPTSVEGAMFNSPANVLMQLLDPSETAMICCPSSMTAGPYIGCYSTLPDYKFTTGCEDGVPNADVSAVDRTFWFDGETLVASVYTLVGTESLTHTLGVTFQDPYTSSLVAYSVLPFVTMIHKPADYSAVATAEATTTSNAAARLSYTTGSWDAMGIMFSVTVLSMVLGAAIILV